MRRVFVGLAVSHIILMLGTGGIGLVLKTGNPQQHVLLAILTLLLGCLIQVGAFTYLTVSFKYLGQVVHLNGLDYAYVEKAKDIKRKFTRFLAIVIFSIVAMSSTGGIHWRTRSDSVIHITAAVIGFVCQLAAYYFEFDIIDRNSRLVTRALWAVNEKRGR